MRSWSQLHLHKSMYSSCCVMLFRCFRCVVSSSAAMVATMLFIQCDCNPHPIVIVLLMVSSHARTMCIVREKRLNTLLEPNGKCVQNNLDGCLTALAVKKSHCTEQPNTVHKSQNCSVLHFNGSAKNSTETVSIAVTLVCRFIHKSLYE